MTVRQTRNTMSRSLRSLRSRLDQIPKLAYEQWLKNTPKNEGNARKNTSLKGDIIHADYPYATVLDKGSSSQAPRGMSRPTSEFVRRYTDRAMRK